MTKSYVISSSHYVALSTNTLNKQIQNHAAANASVSRSYDVLMAKKKKSLIPWWNFSHVTSENLAKHFSQNNVKLEILKDEHAKILKLHAQSIHTVNLEEDDLDELFNPRNGFYDSFENWSFLGKHR